MQPVAWSRLHCKGLHYLTKHYEIASPSLVLAWFGALSAWKGPYSSFNLIAIRRV